MSRPRSVDLTNPFLDELNGICEVLLIRHGEQHYRDGMTLGEGVDAPLSELGRRQAAAVGERLAERAIDVVYASPLQRAHDTGAAIARHHDLEPVTLDELREVDLWGALPQDKPLRGSLSDDELRAIYRKAQRTQNFDAYTYGEPMHEFRSRVTQTIETLIERHSGQRIVVACHGGVIGTYLAHLWSASVDQPCHVHHTSISTVRAMGDHRRVVAVNDFTHVLPFQTSLNPDNAQ